MSSPTLSVNDNLLVWRLRPSEEPELVGLDPGECGDGGVSSCLCKGNELVVGVMGCRCEVPLWPPRMMGDGPSVGGIVGPWRAGDSDRRWRRSIGELERRIAGEGARAGSEWREEVATTENAGETAR